MRLDDCNLLTQVLQYLLDDVSDFLSTRFVAEKEEGEMVKEKGCLNIIKAFIDHLSERERENFRSRKQDNVNSVTLTTIHQVIFIYLFIDIFPPSAGFLSLWQAGLARNSCIYIHNQFSFSFKIV